MRKFWTAFVKGTEGQDLIEYALLAALVALGATAGMQLLATGINTEFGNISTSLINAS